MLAGTLQEAGLELGHVMTESLFNRKGTRESRGLMVAQEKLLAQNGGSWKDPPESVRWGGLDGFRERFVARFRNERVWGFKDPRTLFTLEGWIETLPHAELVGIFRHPARVALSLRKRNQLTLEKGFGIWQRYNETLLRLHCERKFPLIEFVDDPRALQESLRELVVSLRLPRSERRLDFFEDRLRATNGISISVPKEIEQLYRRLQRRAFQPEGTG